MKKEIYFSENEMQNILKEHLKLKKRPIIYFSGGILKPLKVVAIHYEETEQEGS